MSPARSKPLERESDVPGGKVCYAIDILHDLFIYAIYISIHIYVYIQVYHVY